MTFDPNHEERKNYLHNRSNYMEDFDNYLEEAQRDEPSVPGIIAGSNFKQFSAWAVFHHIIEQEWYAKNKLKAPWVDSAEEKKLLKKMIKKAKAVFEEDYDAWYKHVKKE